MNYGDEYEENSTIKVTARRVSDNALVHVNNTSKSEGPFYCPDTFEDLVLRRCIEKRDHFAYKARYSPVGSKESDLHKGCKKEIWTILNDNFPDGNWKEERQIIDSGKGSKDRRADISGRIDGKGIIIEVQASVLPIKEIIERTEQYTLRRGYILWIVPLEKELGKENFRPRLFERYLHTMYYGRVYYWNIGDGTLLTPVHFGTATRHIEADIVFDSDGTEIDVGGYDKPYLRIKKPIYGKKVDLIHFTTENRKKFDMENEKLSVKESKIFRDNLSKWW